jgi:hypothetical protein
MRVVTIPPNTLKVGQTLTISVRVCVTEVQIKLPSHNFNK